jgi:high-affinity nickel-transport protein
MADFSASMQPLSLLWLGLLLGLRHAADADHVAAVGAIAARTRQLWPAARLGIVWGLGHTLTLATVAGGIVLFNLAVPPRLALAMELCVAVALIAVGALNVRTHSHERGDRLATRGPQSAFLFGLIHGLAGSAAVALIVVAAVGDAKWVSAYLLVFGLGTLIGMTLITTGFAFPLVVAARRCPGGGHAIRVVSGVASVATGLWLAYQVGWIDGLFLGSQPPV